MPILMTGASGLIGRHLCRALVRRGESILALSRQPQPPQAGITWHVGDATDPQFVKRPMAHCRAVVNLAGESVAQRWTAARKKAIRTSRLQVTQALVTALSQLAATKAGPTALLSTSAVGYYGYANAGPCDETAPAGTGFLADTCRDWEAAAQAVEAQAIRCVRLRLGVVLAREAGALPQIIRPIRAFVGSALGTGTQWLSWVHIDDVVGLYLRALDDRDLSGPLNCVAPEATQNATLTATAAKILRRPLWAPRVPGVVLKLALGNMAEEALLGGQHVVPQRALALGFGFAYPQLQAALTDLLLP